MMHSPEEVFKCLKKNGINFFSGVPDSLMKDFCNFLSIHLSNDDHVIAQNEGTAIALATGHYIQSGNPGLVYMQNSGIGNAINPLLSLADNEVYGIPMVLLIGWRGEPGFVDEPQHIKQGRITEKLLDSLEIPCFRFGSTNDIQVIFHDAIALTKKIKSPVAVLVHKDTFSRYEFLQKPGIELEMSREEVIDKIIDGLSDDEVVISSTGMISRELNECRVAKGYGEGIDFLTVGSMGHASSIALGMAKSQKEMKIICLDGDGAVLMHMGALASIGQSSLRYFFHIILNNGSHDSVGGQPTLGLDIDLPKVALACGYDNSLRIKNFIELDIFLKSMSSYRGSTFIDIQIKKGARKNLGRPFLKPGDNLNIFRSRLRDLNVARE